MSRPRVLAFTGLALGWVAFARDHWIFLVTGAIPLAAAALGLLVLHGWAREISLASAGLFGSSMYMFGWLDRPDNQGVGLPWIPAAVLIVTGAAALMGLLALLTLRLPGIYLIVVSLGLQGVLEKLVFAPGRFSGGISGGTELGIPITNPRPGFFGLDLRGDTTFYFFALSWLAIALALLVRYRHSPAGLAVQLVGADRQAAAAVGIAPLRHRLAVFAVSGALVGFAGVLGSWFFVNPPVFTNYLAPFSLFLLAIPVLAGRDALAWVLGIAVAMQVIPFALEGLHLNSFLLAGIGLGLGTLAGSRGLGGRAQDLLSGQVPPEEEPDAMGPVEALAVLRRWIPGTASDTAALATDGVRVRIGGADILRDVAIHVPAGEIVGLIGPNGAGKSTLLDVIAGIRPAQGGRVELFGEDATDLPAWQRARRGLTRSFQSTRVVDDLTVGENLLIGAATQCRATTVGFLAGSARSRKELLEAEEAARAMAVVLGIDRHWDRRASTLEFSARRRLDIGRALLARPRLLVLDEPAAGLDPITTRLLFDLIRGLHRDLGLTVLLVEHHVYEVFDTCSLVHVLAAGRMIASGTPVEIAADGYVRECYLGDGAAYQGSC
ncbi:MAG: branched-chain amino acid ABC transporter ATP-binding protein/permease [Sporichthyaceae bacterium]